MRLFIILSGVSVGLMAFIIFFILRSTLTLCVKFLIGPHRFEWYADVYLWRRKVWTYQLRHGKGKTKNKSTMKKLDKHQIEDEVDDEALYGRLKQIICILRTVPSGKKIKISHLVWITTCGTGDASETALLCGAIWSIKASTMPWIAPLSSDRPRINVVPMFQRKCLNSDISCMFQVRIGDAIAMIKKIRRQLKEG
ncbi:DUF2953 domain-containing protein [Sporolactobacillus nakayamae]|uniref:DUF2953 domain-containing protein n=1 Tax=Sporolactobacillus nakayamae TaxID=269670 RepID=A0A1I2RZK0_9BACL|nr:DUF2953 domain-containing protein [Sporolactobacillus nakayamae]SFG43181.1 Protein of unknown function [Sporolactobacillus nakayamae]